MKEIFLIDNKLENPKQPVLVLRIGDEHLSYAIVDKSNSTLHQLSYYEVENYADEILINCWNSQSILQQYFFEVQIAFDFKKNGIHLENTNIDKKADLLTSLFGNLNAETIITESIHGWHLENTYMVPEKVKQFLEQKFPAAKWRNQFSVHLLQTTTTEPIIRLEFRQRTFTLLITVANQLLLAQTFEYTTSADVLYYLLKCCQQFSLSQQTVGLYISGLIDKESALYKELCSYFIQVNFCDVSWTTNDEYPAHFFTSLNELFLCAS